MGMDQCKAELCIFRRMDNKSISLLIGVHADGIDVPGEKDVCDAFLDELKEDSQINIRGSWRCTLVVRSCGTGSLLY